MNRPYHRHFHAVGRALNTFHESVIFKFQLTQSQDDSKNLFHFQFLSQTAIPTAVSRSSKSIKDIFVKVKVINEVTKTGN